MLILMRLKTASVHEQYLLNQFNFLRKFRIVKSQHSIRVHDLHPYSLVCLVVSRHDPDLTSLGRSDQTSEQIDYDLL